MHRTLFYTLDNMERLHEFPVIRIIATDWVASDKLKLE